MIKESQEVFTEAAPYYTEQLGVYLVFYQWINHDVL